MILSSGVNVNHMDAHGNTALHLSCANGHADVITALIKAGAKHLPNGAGNRYSHAKCWENCAFPLRTACNLSSRHGVPY